MLNPLTPFRRTPRITPLLFALALGALVALGACGGRDVERTPNDPSDPSQSTPSTPSTPSNPSTPNPTQPPIAAGAVTITTDRLQYPAPAQVKATLSNGRSDSVFLEGCSIFAVQRRESGAWKDLGPTKICVWQGLARVVQPGGAISESVTLSQAGTYRIATHFGSGCTPGKPLSSAGCAHIEQATSAAFSVGAPAPAAGVVVRTDRQSYRVGETATASVDNLTAASIYLQGCTQVTREERVNGQWVDRGRLAACVWEGIAVEVASHATFVDPEPVRFTSAGTWRVALDYGVGCRADAPLSGASCTSHQRAVSAPVTVTP